MNESNEGVISALSDYELDAVIDLVETMGTGMALGYLRGIRAARKEAERRSELQEKWGG